MLRQRQPRQHDNRHLDFIRSLPCICCGDNTTTEAAHARFASPQWGKRYVGKGEKPDDRWTLPLCGKHHREQHDIGELRFWDKYKIDPIKAALALHSFTGDYATGLQIVNANH